MRERTNSDGTVTYQVLFRDGKRQSSKSFVTAKAAEHFQKSIELNGVRRALADLAEADDGALTLDEVARAFFEFKRTRVRSDRTVVDYERDYRNWIKGEFGNRAAVSITEADVQDWVDRLDRMRKSDGSRRLEPKTIAGYHSLLHSFYKYACAPARSLVPTSFNPCNGTDLPKRLRRPPEGIRINAWLAMYAGLKQKGMQNGIGDDAADLGQFLIASGWRISEAIALDESGCDDDGEFITCYVLQVMRRQADNTFRVVEDAKSRAGGRRVKLDPDASEMLRRRLRSTPRGGLVFRRGDHEWTYSTFRNVYWVGASKIAGFPKPAKIHQLRHAAVGIFHLSGASLAEIQRRIGHESIQTTIDVYGGMIDDMSDDSLDKVASILRGEQPRRRGELGS